MLSFIQAGCGGHGGSWVKNFMGPLVSEGRVKPVGLVDVNEEALDFGRQAYGISADDCFTDADEAFGKVDADFAVVCVPPKYHEGMINLALDKDMDVICEKPLCDTMEGCCRVYKKAVAAGRKMSVTMSHRFDQDKQSLERLIKSGKYGPVDYIIGRNTWAYRKFASWSGGDGFRYKMDDPLLVDALVHHFDVMRSLSGGNALTVYARTWNPSWSEFAGDASGFIVLEMDNGVKVFYEGAKPNATQLNGWGRDYWRAECRDATLVLDNRQIGVLSDEKPELAEDHVPLFEQEKWKNAWLAEMFVDWVEGGEEPPNTVEDNINCCALLFAALESAHSGRVVNVKEFLDSKLGEV